MKHRQNPLAAGTAFALLLLSGLVLPDTAWSATWIDRLPADDPGTVPSRHITVYTAPASPEQQSSTSLAGSLAGGVYGATTFVLWSAVGVVQSVSSATSEALWETAYMFGMNSTPVPRPTTIDPVTDIAPASTRSDAQVQGSAVSPPTAPTVRLAQLVMPAEAKATDAVAGSAAADSGSGAAQSAPSQSASVSTVQPPSGRAAEPAALPPIEPGLLANFIYDRGARRADGSFFVPKPLQRLFEVRTQRVSITEVPVTLSLAGRIIADPKNHGDVETSLLGRIEPPDSGLPVLGQTVHAGDILAYVIPAVGVVDRTQVRSQVAKLTTDIRVETENLEILKQFSFVPFRDGKIYQSEQRIAGLRREREALLPLLQTQEVLRASADGVISTSNAIAGRIVHPGESVFTIVNPAKLWIEALAPDPAIAESAARVRQATAVTPEGQSLALTFVGSGLALKEQSVPVLFQIDNPPDGLRIGRPVTVTVQSENHSQAGLPVTRDALTIGADGVQEVWEQSEPEVFLPHAVRTVDLDGRSVLVVDGLKEGTRVVVSGVRLLAQLQ
jgi:membrane fusion protein, heavy metal efflux system